MLDETVQSMKESMEKAIQAFKRELARVRTGRANLALLDGIKVEYYGVPTPINQIAALAVPDPRLITIKPWDKKLIGPIEKAIVAADLGLTPSNDGDIVRIPIPPLTTERRRELVRQVRKMAEECKVAVRNIRREHKGRIDKAEGLPEDDKHRTLDRIDKETDTFIKRVDSLLEAKEKEIMEL